MSCAHVHVLRMVNEHDAIIFIEVMCHSYKSHVIPFQTGIIVTIINNPPPIDLFNDKEWELEGFMTYNWV